MSDRDMARQMGRECLAFRVRRASRVVSRVYDQVLEGAGLSATQLTVLVAVYNRPDLKMVELAEELGFEPSSLSRALGLLVRKKWLAPTKSTNKRERFFEVTERGVKKMREAYVLWEKAQADTKRALGPDRIGELLGALDALRSMQLQ